MSEEPQHPDGIHLDSLALGGSDAKGVPDAVRQHVASCASCKEYVVALRREISVAPSVSRLSMPAPPSSIALITATPSAPPARKRPFLHKVITFGPVFAAAAALLVYFRLQSLNPESTYEPTAAPSTSAPEVHFKGGLPMAVVRERDGTQSRHTERVEIHAGDRLRIEVAVDVAQPIAAGILDADGTFTSLLAPALLDPGTHYSDQAARIDEHPSAGWVLAGEPSAVQLACKTHDWSHVAALPVVVDGSAGGGTTHGINETRVDGSPPP